MDLEEQARRVLEAYREARKYTQNLWDHYHGLSRFKDPKDRMRAYARVADACRLAGINHKRVLGEVRAELVHKKLSKQAPTEVEVPVPSRLDRVLEDAFGGD